MKHLLDEIHPAQIPTRRYVLRHNGDLPRPEMRELFPRNYEDFRYREGIAAEIPAYLI